MNLVLDDIKLRYDDISFHYQAYIEADIVGVFGLSGSGKTTLMNIISGMVMPESGRIAFNQNVFFDKESKTQLAANKRNIGLVFQEHNLFPHLSVKKNLLYSQPYLKNKGKKISFKAVTELLQIEHLLDKKTWQLSGGERQRVAIGRSLLAQPELLLMDEPFSNLDRDRREQIISYLLKINKQFSVPIVIISHDLEDILKLTQYLLIVEDRKIKKYGNYLDIADSGAVSNLISYKKYINVLELDHLNYNETENLNTFSLPGGDATKVLRTNSNLFAEKENRNKLSRLCIYPDDIAVSKHPIKDSSIQNQLEGVITDIQYISNSCFVTVDTGVDLVVELTVSAIKHMQLDVGAGIYCLIKAKAVKIIHVYQ